ncbi:hypothetical protein [Georgenia daeguensis]|uniref:Zinc-finger domain-containing protein n=1 Tax=Georgenia daeguensis TaxID=908355 RepID=A0ABP8ETG2_9MICO
MSEQHPGRTAGHPGQDALVDLALGEVVEPGRSALARHLVGCEQCREEYASVAAGLEQVLAAAPTVAPPPGFEARALAAMGPGRRGGDGASSDVVHGAGSRGRRDDAPTSAPPTPGARRPRAHRRRTVLVAAAAAVVELAVGAGGALLATQEGAVPDPEPTVAEPRGAAELVKADGTVVGRVTASRFAGDAVLVVDVAAAPTGVRYECRGVLPDGTEVELGTWTIGPERSAIWVVRDPGATGVRLVTDSGRVWADAQL